VFFSLSPLCPVCIRTRNWRWMRLQRRGWRAEQRRRRRSQRLGRRAVRRGGGGGCCGRTGRGGNGCGSIGRGWQRRSQSQRLGRRALRGGGGGHTGREEARASLGTGCEPWGRLVWNQTCSGPNLTITNCSKRETKLNQTFLSSAHLHPNQTSPQRETDP
jgi:hypothetical protein